MFSLKELIYLLSHTFYHLIHPPPILINFESIFWEYLDCGLTHTQRRQPKIPVGIVKDTLVTFIYLQEPLKKNTSWFRIPEYVKLKSLELLLKPLCFCLCLLCLGSEERINWISEEAPLANWQRMPVKVELNRRQLIGTSRRNTKYNVEGWTIADWWKNGQTLGVDFQSWSNIKCIKLSLTQQSWT